MRGMENVASMSMLSGAGDVAGGEEGVAGGRVSREAGPGAPATWGLTIARMEMLTAVLEGRGEESVSVTRRACADASAHTVSAGGRAAGVASNPGGRERRRREKGGSAVDVANDALRPRDAPVLGAASVTAADTSGGIAGVTAATAAAPSPAGLMAHTRQNTSSPTVSAWTAAV